jgi:hypothetical protein
VGEAVELAAAAPGEAEDVEEGLRHQKAELAARRPEGTPLLGLEDVEAGEGVHVEDPLREPDSLLAAVAGDLGLVGMGAERCQQARLARGGESLLHGRPDMGVEPSRRADGAERDLISVAGEEGRMEAGIPVEAPEERAHHLSRRRLHPSGGCLQDPAEASTPRAGAALDSAAQRLGRLCDQDWPATSVRGHLQGQVHRGEVLDDVSHPPDLGAFSSSSISRRSAVGGFLSFMPSLLLRRHV